MKTVPFSDLLSEICQLIGLDKVTLNEKSFATIRDFTSRRIGTIWDREEWPDTNRYIRTFPGTPIRSAISFGAPPLVTQENVSITTESEEDLLFQTSDNLKDLQLFLDEDFPRIYTADFLENAYRLGTIASTEITFQNPFFYKYNGESVSIADTKTMYKYETNVDEVGEYIIQVFLKIPIEAVVEFPSVYEGPNGKLTTTIIFDKNPKRIVELPTNSVQGLAAWQVDPRTTTRAVPLDFVVEDMYNSKTKEATYLTFLQTGQKYIQYRLSAPRLNGTQYLEGLGYFYGSQVYYDPSQESSDFNPIDVAKATRGDFWNCIQDDVYFAPSFPSEFWAQASIPYRFKDYLVNAVSADFLKSEGRADEAQALENLAEMAVQQQIDVLIRQQGQNQKLNMAYTY